ncbi:hypothetical protein C8039_00395 [Halogeometricum sp. wsp3]|nr:hypothetical protein C8039_00395 [Halogeometricum sp. wsp3]
MAISRDITERKEREQELEQQNEQLEQFASVVSHDLRNPLTVARGQLELVRNLTASISTLSSLHTSAGYAHDGLHIARDGASPASPVVVDVEQFVQTRWQNVDTTAATLRTDIDRPIRADDCRLRNCSRISSATRSNTAVTT